MGAKMRLCLTALSWKFAERVVCVLANPNCPSSFVCPSGTLPKRGMTLCSTKTCATADCCSGLRAPRGCSPWFEEKTGMGCVVGWT